MVIGFILLLFWAFLTHYIAYELLCPISFSLGILAHFLILHFHGLLITLLGFPGPITISFILGAHGLPLTPYFLTSLLRACWGPFLLFYITWCPWVYYFFLWDPLGPVAFLKTYLFTLWAYDPLFLPFGLNGFSINPLTLLCPYCWASSDYWASPKWASTVTTNCFSLSL